MSNQKMTFEEASLKLDEVVRRMEDKRCPLNESIKLYEQAYELIVYCKKKLDEAKSSVTDINDKIASLKDANDSLFED